MPTVADNQAIQKSLHTLILSIKENRLKRLTDLKPLREYVACKASFLSVNDREDVVSLLLGTIYRGKFVPREDRTFLYLRQRLINVLYESGHFRSSRYKAGRRLKCVPLHEDYSIPYHETAYHHIETYPETNAS